MSEVILPELGEGIDSAVVAGWNVKVGDKVNEGDELVEVVTDKANFNVSSEVSGEVKEIIVAEGEKVKIGATLALIAP